MFWGILLREFWRLLPGTFQEGFFSGHFAAPFPTNMRSRYLAAKAAKNPAAQTKKTANKLIALKGAKAFSFAQTHATPLLIVALWLAPNFRSWSTHTTGHPTASRLDLGDQQLRSVTGMVGRGNTCSKGGGEERSGRRGYKLCRAYIWDWAKLHARSSRDEIHTSVDQLHTPQQCCETALILHNSKDLVVLEVLRQRGTDRYIHICIYI